MRAISVLREIPSSIYYAFFYSAAIAILALIAFGIAGATPILILLSYIHWTQASVSRRMSDLWEANIQNSQVVSETLTLVRRQDEYIETLRKELHDALKAKRIS